jgi:hypothetical protein
LISSLPTSSAKKIVRFSGRVGLELGHVLRRQVGQQIEVA